MAESMDSPICSVCLEGFTPNGDGCPKLLPCSHTVCVSCLMIFRQGNPFSPIQCPECRVFHQLPRGGTNGFPTNRYVLQILGLEQKITEKERNDAEVILCHVHRKPCVMFCLKKECWKTLCPKCPTQEHQEHNVVSLAECVQESKELKHMKQGVVDVRQSLDAYEAQVAEATGIVLRKETEAREAIEKTAREMKLMIDKKSKELKKRIRQSCDDELEHLEAILDDVNKKIDRGITIEDDIDNLSGKIISKGVQELIRFKNRCSDFQKLARQEKPGRSYRLPHFNRIECTVTVGDFCTTSHSIFRLRGQESVRRDGGTSSSSSIRSTRKAPRASESEESVGPARSSRGRNGARRSTPY